MTKIQSSTNYKDFMKGLRTMDDVGRATTMDSFDVVVKSQGRWKSIRFVYESETKWCNTPGQVDDILLKNMHLPYKGHADGRRMLGQQNAQAEQRPAAGR